MRLPTTESRSKLPCGGRDNERNRLDRIEGKIAPIIAGTIAAFALFLDKANGWLDIAAGALYLIPLWQLFVAFRTHDYIDVPSQTQAHDTSKSSSVIS
jgi:hypothetical protein